MIALLLLLVPSALAIVTVIFVVALHRPRLAPVRAILAGWRFKWLAYAIPFSPAASYLLLRTQLLGTLLMPARAALSLLVTSISSASLAACWLCIPDDPARRIHIGYAVLLAIVLWLLDLFAIGGLGWLLN